MYPAHNQLSELKTHTGTKVQHRNIFALYDYVLVDKRWVMVQVWVGQAWGRAQVTSLTPSETYSNIHPETEKLNTLLQKMNSGGKDQLTLPSSFIV